MADGIASHEREAAPPLAVLDRLEQEPRRVADELQERGDRCLEVAEQLGPHGHDAVFGGESVELVAGRLQVHEPNLRKKQVRAPVWQAPAPSCSTRNSNVSPSQS